jgi:transcriptional regulator with XRE-family HTH domain
VELNNDALVIMTPVEMRRLRKELAGWTLDRLSEESKINKTQLSRFENARNGLTRSQVETCKGVLLRAAAERERQIAALFLREGLEEMVAES